VVMRQHNIWCVCVRPVWRGMLDCSPAYLCTQNAEASFVICCAHLMYRLCITA